MQTSARQLLQKNGCSGLVQDCCPYSADAELCLMTVANFLIREYFVWYRQEIGELLSILGEACDCIPPLLLYGAAATGKTSIVCEIMRVLGRPHAYASCHSCHNPRLLFESILNQLVGHIRSAANNYASVRRCERLPDFIEHLPGACAEAMSCQKSVKKQGISSSKKVFEYYPW